MQLNILADGEVGDSVGVTAGEVGDRPQLVRSHHAVGNADAHHEALQRAAHAALAAGDARAVALGVNAPPAEVGADPFGGNGIEAFAGEAADFVQAFPRILCALQALDSLCRSFLLGLSCCRHK